MFPSLNGSSSSMGKNTLGSNSFSCAMTEFSRELHERIQEKKMRQSQRKRKNSSTNQLTLPNISNTGLSSHQATIPSQLTAESYQIEQLERKIRQLEKETLVQKQYEQMLKKYTIDENQPPYHSPQRQVVVVKRPSYQKIQKMAFQSHHPPNPLTLEVQRQHSISIQSKLPSNKIVPSHKSIKNVPVQQQKITVQQPKTTKQKLLKRKFKVAALAAYFSIVFPRYCKRVTKQRYQLYKKASKKNKLQKLTEKIREKFLEMDLLGMFLECQAAEKQKNKEIVDFFAVRNDVKFSVSSVVMMRFTTNLFNELTKMVKENELKSFYKILVYFLPNSFPLPHFLLREELAAINFSTINGKMNINNNFSQVLLINLFLIKILIFYILMHESNEKQILQIAYKKNKINKKLLILTAEKLKIYCLFMYYTLNKLMISHFKKGNYKNLSKKLKISPLEPLIYEYDIAPKSRKALKKKQEDQDINLIQNIDDLNDFRNMIEDFYDAYSSEINKKAFKFGKMIQNVLKDYAKEKLLQIKQNAKGARSTKKLTNNQLADLQQETDSQEESDEEQDVSQPQSESSQSESQKKKKKKKK